MRWLKETISKIISGVRSESNKFRSGSFFFKAIIDKLLKVHHQFDIKK